MTIKKARMRSIVEPLWQEVRSLWSGVDFAFYDASNAESGVAQEMSAVNRAESAAGKVQAGPAAARFERCW